MKKTTPLISSQNIKNGLVLFAFAILSTWKVAAQSRDSVIVWNGVNKLRYADFLAPIPQYTDYGAISRVTIDCYFDLDNRSYKLDAIFYKDSSWISLRSNYVLNHEQKHFDLCEVYARAIRKYLKSVINTNIQTFIVERKIDSFMKMEIQQQERYDTETENGSDTLSQLRWNKKITKMLSSFKAYENR